MTQPLEKPKGAMSVNDFAIWAGASLSLLMVILLILHWFGYVPTKNPPKIETQIQIELKDVTIACISAVHQIGSEPAGPERERRLRGAIEISAAITKIELKLSGLLKAKASSAQIAASLKNDFAGLKALIDSVSDSNPAFEVARMEVNELVKLTEK